MAKNIKCAVIGAGLGGLTAAIRLALYGAEVHLFEQHAFPGGKAGELKKAGFRFDTGPSILTMPFILEKIFLDAGEQPASYLTIERLKILCKYFYADGSTLNVDSQINAFADEIEKKTSDTADSVLRYLGYSKTIYELTADLFLFGNFQKISSLLNRKALHTLMNIAKIDPFRSMHAANTSFFYDPKNIQLFDRYATYNGSNPYRAPATLNIIQHVEFNLGGYIVHEGIHAIPQALEKLAKKKGVAFHYKTQVQSIAHLNNRVIGIQVHNQLEPFDCVVSNVDAAYTFKYLIKEKSRREARRIARREPSSSALIFYWGMRQEPSDSQLDTHNIFFSQNYEKEFNDIFQQKKCPDDPTIYVYISSRFKASDAPKGCENWFVMVNAPFDNGQDWDEEADKTKKIIIKRLSTILQSNIGERIVCEEIATPVTIGKQTGSLYGSLYGISSNSLFSAFLRQPNESRDYERLYFCGGSTHPGGGIPLVLLSGNNVADSIFSNIK